MQRIKFTMQDGTGSSKFMTLDGVVPLMQHIGAIASDFGIKEDQLCLVLATIVLPHPPIIFNDLLETEANFMVGVGIAQMPGSAATANSGAAPSTLLISASNALTAGAALPELDPAQSLLQQGVRTGAHIYVIRRKRSLMNKLLGRRKSVLPSASKDKALSADALATAPTHHSSGHLLTPSGVVPSFNSPSRFARHSISFLLKLISCIEATASASLDLFSRDYSMPFLLAYKTFLDSTSTPFADLDLFGDGSALGALFRHCLASMSPKLLDPIASDLTGLYEMLSVSMHATQLSAHITSSLARLGAEERSLITSWAHLCHDVTELEALNGYTSEVLANIFSPLLLTLEESKLGDSPEQPARTRICSSKINPALTYIIQNPLTTGETPFKKRSKKDKRLRKAPSYVSSNGTSTPAGTRPTNASGADGTELSTSTSTSATSSTGKKKDKSISSGASSASPAPAQKSAAASSGAQSAAGAKSVTNSTSGGDESTDVAAANAQLISQSNTPMFMVADFAWTPSTEGDLVLRKGDILQVLVADPQGWYVGKLLTAAGHSVGVFPSTYCSVITKKEVSSLLKLEELSLFESDDASSDDSSSSVSTSSLYQHLVAARMGGSAGTSVLGITNTGMASPSSPTLVPPGPYFPLPHSKHSPTVNTRSSISPLASPGEPAPSALNPSTPKSPSKHTSPSHTTTNAVAVVEIALESRNSASSLDSASSGTSNNSKPTNKLALSSVAIPNPSSAATFIPPLSLAGTDATPGSISGRSADLSPSSSASIHEAPGNSSPGSVGSAHGARSLVVSDLPRNKDIIRSYSVSSVQVRSDELSSPTNSEPIVSLQPARQSATIQDLRKEETASFTSESEHHGSSPRSLSRPSSQQSLNAGKNSNSSNTEPPRGVVAGWSGKSPSVSDSPTMAGFMRPGFTPITPSTLGSESVKPIKVSQEAERHSRSFPVPPGKGRSSGHLSGEVSSLRQATPSPPPDADAESAARRSVSVSKLPLESIGSSAGASSRGHSMDQSKDRFSLDQPRENNVSPSSTASLGHLPTSAPPLERPPIRRGVSSSSSTHPYTGSTKHRASLPDPILAPLASTGDFFGMSPRTATGEVMSPNFTDRPNHGHYSVSGASNAPRIPLSSSFRPDHGSSWASWAPQRHAAPNKSSRRASGPRSPRTDMASPSLGRTLSPSSSSRNSPRGLLGPNSATQHHSEDELERRTQEVHQLQGNIFALEEFNKVMQNTITEQEMAIERLNRELQLLKVAHNMGVGVSASGSLSVSGNSISPGNQGNETNDTSSVQGDDEQPAKQQPRLMRKRPSRRISTLPDSTLTAAVVSQGGPPTAPSSPTSSTTSIFNASSGPDPMPTLLSSTGSSSSTSSGSSAAAPTSNTPPAPSSSSSPFSPNATSTVTMQAAALIFAVAFLLWVLQPLILAH